MLVTGASGFLGGRLVEALLARGFEVRALVREGQKLPPQVEPAVGRLEEPETIKQALAGVDAVVHGAALVRILASASEFWKVNVLGLEQLLRFAFRGGVSRFLHVSSFLALGPADRTSRGILEPGLETDSGPYFNEYHRTKAEGDRRARAAAAAGMPIAIAYPGVVYGPGTLSEGNLLVRHLLDLRRGRIPALVGDLQKRWSLAHVEDVAFGLVQALEGFRPGARWVLGGENLTLKEMYQTIEQEAGLRMPRWRCPDPLALTVGWSWRLCCRLLGGTPRLTPDLVRIYRHDWACDSNLAERELDYRPRSFRHGLRNTLSWLQGEGLW